ncbi:SMI1/KNR4 family protein [Kitasatospora aureofaciens]|uniref:SMI1/KNR4 family protein n=1 Tax=Kitasatospora aureofaciens TaxID=1894 RepID=UPI0033CF874D
MTDLSRTSGTSVSYPWRELLRDWSCLWLGPDAGEVERRFPDWAHASGWLGAAGAPETDIAALEQRLGATLPLSYRQFLLASNGWLHVNDTEGPLLNAEKVGWLRDLDPELAQTWGEDTADDLPSIPDDEYLRYGDDQDCVIVRREHFRTALQISDWGDSALLMLNPAIINDQGEWEAWAFASWYPGVFRYPSFWDLMVDLIKTDYPDAGWVELGL